MNRQSNRYRDENDFSSSRNYRNSREREEGNDEGFYGRTTSRRDGYAWSGDEDRDYTRRNTKSRDFDNDISEDYGQIYRGRDRGGYDNQRERFDNEGGSYRRSQKDYRSQRNRDFDQEDTSNDNRSGYSGYRSGQNYEDDENGYNNWSRIGGSGQYQDNSRYGRFREEDDEDYEPSRSRSAYRSGDYEDSNEEDWSREGNRRSSLNQDTGSRRRHFSDFQGKEDEEETEYRFPGKSKGTTKGRSLDQEGNTSNSTQGRRNTKNSYKNNSESEY